MAFFEEVARPASLPLSEAKAAIGKAMPLTGEFTSHELTLVGGLGV